ncbi:unnamed protein product [Durusdinium trenchii]|uniref:Uncharacterized protein n=2 Tax=Durusdinium trenchii TaxID=1381693 RepID=A0ABP0PJL1_9DINO
MSAVTIFSDASSLGVTEVTRELLLMSGCAILVDRPFQPSSSQWRLLWGLPPKMHRDDKDALRSDSLQSWFDYLQSQSHWLFVIRRSGAVALLQQMCFGPWVRYKHRKAASYGPLIRTGGHSCK